MNKPYSCPILNTNITVTDMDSIVCYIDDNLSSLKGDYVCVSNVHTTVMAFRDEEYRSIQNGGAFALPDGKPLSLVQRRRGFKMAGRVPGPDLMPRIFELSESRGYTHYFYGSSEETLEKLKEQLLIKFPKLKIAGMYSPPFRALTDDEDKEDINRINESEADFIWVGLGAPKQEKWMALHKNKVCGLMLGVGAGFDFHAGTAKRAPKWIQELCLEWLYRLVHNPKKLLKRYASTNLSFIFRTMLEGNRVKKEIRKEHPKIAMIGHKRIPSREGGVEIVVEEISKRLIDKGYFVDAYNRSGYHVSGREYDVEHEKIYKGIRVITIPTFQNGKLNAIVYTFFATLRSLFGKYDVYHFHAEGPCAMLLITRLRCGYRNYLKKSSYKKDNKKRIVVTIHGLDWQRSKWGNFASKILLSGEKNAVKYADEIIVLSKNVQQYFKDTYNRETIYISNGINKPKAVEALEMTEKWGIRPQDYVLFLARLVPEKGAHYLIEAFKNVKTDKKLVIAGGSSHSKEYANSLEELASGDDRIIFTHFVQGRKLEELFSNAYLFVLPSDVEGMAISLLEAMSYSNACLVSDIPENTEVVGDCAETFVHGNVEDLVSKIQEMLDDDAKIQRLKARSQSYICEKYSWDKVVTETIKAYKR